MSDTAELRDSAELSTTPDGQDSGPAAEAGAPARRRPRSAGLSGMLLPELQSLAGSLGIPGVGRLRKGQLVAAIEAARSGSESPAGGSTHGSTTSASTTSASPTNGSGSNGTPVHQNGSAAQEGSRQNGSHANGTARPSEPTAAETPAAASAAATGSAPASTEQSEQTEPAGEEAGGRRRRRGSSRPAGSAPAQDDGTPEAGRQDAATQDAAPQVNTTVDGVDGASARTDQAPAAGRRDEREQGRDQQRPNRDQQRDQNGGQNRDQNGSRQDQQNDRGNRQKQQGNQSQQGNQNQQGGQNQQGNQNQQGGQNQDDDGNRRGRFRERGRGRNRNRVQVGGGAEPDMTIREDDVLTPIGGILDIHDQYAFVRTTGYLSGPNDVYVSMSQVRKSGLRRGDAITGAVRQPEEGATEANGRRDKFNALVRLDTVNGLPPEEARQRAEFHKLTPLYPNERLRLETEPQLLTTRIIDLVMPLGKGQRALIVSPPKAGKTMVLQAIANAITENNPECHLMVVLVDERPEEVTDMQRSVKGEVIASTFDRPPGDHTVVAELSIERAKRLVELGHDVVVLLDSITRLGRAYNLAAPASGRILSGGVDSTALYPPKRFLGAARNIENGGSLTILATALVETGSTMDTVIFEEFKGTGNAELVLSRKIADKRIFPAVDVDASGTRKEEILLSPDELAIVYKLRRVLHALDPLQGIELLLDRLRKTRTNYEFLMQIAKTTPDERDRD